MNLLKDSVGESDLLGKTSRRASSTLALAIGVYMDSAILAFLVGGIGGMIGGVIVTLIIIRYERRRYNGNNR